MHSNMPILIKRIIIMNSTIGINHLKLSYGPMTLHEFEEAKKDEEVKKSWIQQLYTSLSKENYRFYY